MTQPLFAQLPSKICISTIYSFIFILFWFLIFIHHPFSIWCQNFRIPLFSPHVSSPGNVGPDFLHYCNRIEKSLSIHWNWWCEVGVYEQNRRIFTEFVTEICKILTFRNTKNLNFLCFDPISLFWAKLIEKKRKKRF